MVHYESRSTQPRIEKANRRLHIEEENRRCHIDGDNKCELCRPGLDPRRDRRRSHRSQRRVYPRSELPTGGAPPPEEAAALWSKIADIIRVARAEARRSWRYAASRPIWSTWAKTKHRHVPRTLSGALSPPLRRPSLLLSELWRVDCTRPEARARTDLLEWPKTATLAFRAAFVREPPRTFQNAVFATRFPPPVWNLAGPSGQNTLPQALCHGLCQLQLQILSEHHGLALLSAGDVNGGKTMPYPVTAKAF